MSHLQEISGMKCAKANNKSWRQQSTCVTYQNFLVLIGVHPLAGLLHLRRVLLETVEQSSMN